MEGGRHATDIHSKREGKKYDEWKGEKQKNLSVFSKCSSHINCCLHQVEMKIHPH